MKVGIYKDGKMTIYDSEDSVIMLNLDSYDKDNISSMHEDGDNYLRTDQDIDKEKAQEIFDKFVEIV